MLGAATFAKRVLLLSAPISVGDRRLIFPVRATEFFAAPSRNAQAPRIGRSIRTEFTTKKRSLVTINSLEKIFRIYERFFQPLAYHAIQVLALRQFDMSRKSYISKRCPKLFRAAAKGHS